jgi:hypothetical protein
MKSNNFLQLRTTSYNFVQLRTILNLLVSNKILIIGVMTSLLFFSSCSKEQKHDHGINPSLETRGGCSNEPTVGFGCVEYYLVLENADNHVRDYRF